MKKFLSHAHSQRMSPWKVFGIAAVLLTAATSAQAWVIDFDTASDGSNIMHGQVIDNEYSAGIPDSSVGVDIRGSKSGSPDYAVAFDTTVNGGYFPNYSDDPDLHAPFSNPSLGAANPGNVLIIQENDSYGWCGTYGVCKYPDDNAGGGYFEFKFHDENNDPKGVDITSIDFFDIENSEAGGEIRFWTTDSSGNYQEVYQDTYFVPSTGGDNKWTQLTFNVTNITKFKVYFKGSGAIDNIVGQATGGGGTGVPEPASLALFAGGLLGFAGIRRRWTQGAQTKES